MKNKGTFICALWWLLLLSVTGALLVCFAPRDARTSVAENRMLQGFPEATAENIMSGNFSSEFESFLSDGFFARPSVINLSKKILGTLSAMTAEDEYILDNTEDAVADFGTADSDSSEEPQIPDDSVQTGTAPAQDDAEASTGSTDAALWLEHNNGDTTTVYTYPSDNIDTVVHAIEQYRSLIPADGRVFYAQVPFPKLALRWSGSPDVYSGWESSLEAEIQARSGENVFAFSVADILEPHIKAGEYVYYINDHHWTELGAYYVFAEMAASQQLPVIPYSEYEYKINKSSPGSDGRADEFRLLYALQPTRSLVVSSIDCEEELPLMYYDTQLYHAFLASTQTPWRRIITGFNTGRNALVIGDSFVNAFTPYLLPYYNEVHLTDIRPIYFDRDELGTSIADMITRNSIDDIYFIFSEANSVNTDTQLSELLGCLYA